MSVHPHTLGCVQVHIKAARSSQHRDRASGSVALCSPECFDNAWTHIATCELRYILEKYYNVRVAGMYVVCFHPDVGESPFVDTVPFMPAEVEAMMQDQRHRHLNV